MEKYKVSPVTTFDEDEQIYQTKVGFSEGKMDLLYIACGKTEHESRYRAVELVALLIK